MKILVLKLHAEVNSYREIERKTPVSRTQTRNIGLILIKMEPLIHYKTVGLLKNLMNETQDTLLVPYKTLLKQLLKTLP